MVSPNLVKKIPIAIGIKPSQPTTFTNKTLDFGSGTGNIISNVPNSGLENNSININGVPVELGGSVDLNQFTIEYSSDPSAPTPVGAANGHFHFEGDVSGTDVDYATFVVGAQDITALYLNYYESVDNVAFFAIMPGSSWTAGQNTSLMTAYGHFGPSDVNTDVLGGATLTAGQAYTIWVQQTGDDSTKYIFSTDSSYLGMRGANTDTTYSIKASTVSGGANLDLDSGGSSSPSTDSVKFQGGGNVAVTRVDDNTILISDGGALGGVAITDESVATLTNKSIDFAIGTGNVASNIPNTALQYSTITINGDVVSLGGNVTISGGGGSGDVTLSGAETLTNKSMSGADNTFSDIPNDALENDSISINGTPVALGTNFNVSGLGDVTTTGQQTLSNKSLLNPVIQDMEIIGEVRVGQGNAANAGQSGYVLKSTGTGVQWAQENQTTAAALAIGTGLSGVGGSNFDGSNGITITVDTSITATLTGTQILTNKTLTAPNLTGDLTIDNVSGQVGQAIVSDGAGGLAWGSSGGGGGGSFNGPTSSTDNAIARFDGTTGALAQDSLVTISDTGIITAPSVGSIVPSYFASNLALPSATGGTVNGAICVTATDNSVYYASNGNWTRLAKESEAAIQTRQTFSPPAVSLTNNTHTNIDITGSFKSYLLLKIQTTHAAWVRVYTSDAARSADSSRDIDTDPLPGSGVIAEVITTTGQTQVLTPAVIGFNDDSTPAATIYLRVQNRSGTTNNVGVTLTALKLEA